MGYSSGMLKDHITVLNRTKAVMGEFGLDSSGTEWEETGCYHASVTWNKGMRTLQEGAIDAYGVKMVRMRWTPCINMRSRIRFDGITYEILPETFNPDRQENTIQFLAQAIINDSNT